MVYMDPLWDSLGFFWIIQNYFSSVGIISDWMAMLCKYLLDSNFASFGAFMILGILKTVEVFLDSFWFFVAPKPLGLSTINSDS